jgi:ligand-binding sensor domain-containing protein/class 3 adenylate cyclase
MPSAWYVHGRALSFPTMRHHAYTLLLALLSLAPQLLCAQQYDLRSFSLEQGLPSASVNALCEDRDGFLWVATDEGAARSDGVNFNIIGRQQGLPADDVTALHCGSDGRVWLGFRNGAIAAWRQDGVTVYPHAPGLPKAAIRAMATGPDGALWIATLGNGMLRLDDKDRSPEPLTDGPPHALVRALVNDGRGGLVAGTDSGLYRWHNARWQHVAPAALPHPQVFALYADSLGMLVGTANGYAELDTALVPLPPQRRFAGSYPITLPDARILAILRARNGDIWLGTPAGMLHLGRRAGQPQMKVIGEANGLGHDLVRTMLQDRSGAVWAGTAFGGVSKFISDAFMHFTDRDGLGSRIVSAIHRTPDGLLWFGTVGGGVAQWDGQRLRNYDKADGLSDTYVLAVSEDRGGHLLVGTGTQGIFRMLNGRLIPHALPGHRVMCMQQDAEERLWIGSDKGLYADVGDARPIAIGPHRTAIHGLAPAGDTLWVTTSQGLFLVDTRRMPWRLERMPLLPAIPMTDLVRDSRGNLWIGTEGHGLYRLNGHTVDSLSTHNGLSSHSVEQVLLDAYEDIWLGTRRGIDHLQLDELQERVLRIVNHGAEEGFVGIETFRNAGMLDSDSTLWFGTVRGATRYDPRRTLTEAREPQVHFTDLRLFFEVPDWQPWCAGMGPDGLPKDLRLPHDRNHLTFGFTGISLAYPERVRYSYILEGYDPEWTLNTSTDRVTYSNIPPGEYVFRVEAGNGRGWTQEPLSFHFRVAPPFWQTAPFRLGGGLFVLLAIGGYIRMRERRLRKDRERLEGMVAKRTRELATEKDRSEKLLLNILPAATAQELMTKGTADARRYESCTVLFSDFKGFTGFSSLLDSDTLVAELDHFFRLFDQLCARHRVEKIKTIGDAYMCATGLPEPDPNHALAMVLMGLAMVDAVERSNAERRAKGLQEWPVRIGIHSGPLVAGVVGEKKFAYDIWGDTVNLASRMEANSEAGQVNISGATYAQVIDHVDVVPRGPIRVKGKGEVNMYFVKGLKPVLAANGNTRLPNEALLKEFGIMPKPA